MKVQAAFIAILFFSAISGFAQQIPFGTCGIVHVYDAAGNRTKRVYFCNNGSNPYPQRANPNPATETIPADSEFESVDALYPNPTTGIFSVTFSKAIDQARVSLTDAAGKVLTTIKASGNKVVFDLSGRAGGVYYIRIEEKGKTITKKVIKQ